DAAAAAERLLATARTTDGAPLFDIDNRGADLFVMLTWPDDVADDLNFTIGGALMGPLKPQIAFVAIKNGRHNGVGYFADSGVDKP
ncbi:hypothetical protein NL436_27625, partial [Klebsiella pneumoniae]|nr:hypothetical protein [Klebsiella pneumoniae]